MTKKSLAEIFKSCVVLIRYDKGAAQKNRQVPFMMGPSPDPIGGKTAIQTFLKNQVPLEYLAQMNIPEDEKSVMSKGSGGNYGQPPLCTSLREARIMTRTNKKWLYQLWVPALLGEKSFPREVLATQPLVNMSSSIPDDIRPVAAVVPRDLSLEDIHQGKKPELVIITDGDGGPIRLFAEGCLPKNLWSSDGQLPMLVQTLEGLCDAAAESPEEIVQVPMHVLIEMGYQPEDFSKKLEQHEYARTSEGSEKSEKKPLDSSE